ncbi:MAG: FecR domain-containing protein [Variovorax sp.]
MRSAVWSRAGAAAVLALAAAVAASQAHSAAAPPFVRHRVVAGDTLASIGARYLRSPTQWRELQAVNRIADPDRLAPGSVVRVPRRLLRPAGLATAQIEFVQGASTGVMPAQPSAPAGEPAQLSAGDAVSEGTRLQVPKDGYLRLRLADGSIVRVLADSDVELKRLRARRPGSPSQSVIEVRKGKVESDVAPQPKGRKFEIEAPGAVASVRGTQFDVAVGEDGRVATAVSEGTVRLQPTPRAKGRRRAAPADVKAGQGAVVDAAGQLGPRRALPAAPDLSQLAAVYEDADVLALALGDAAAPAGGFEVRLARDAALQEVLRNGSFKAGRVQFPTPEDGDYTIGVRVVDADGLTGAESRRAIRVHARPVPPLYRSPAPRGRVPSDGGQLVCSELAGAQGVVFEVASEPDFRSVRLRELRREGCRLELGGLPPGDYWWRVASVARGDVQGAHGPFALPQPFSVVPTPEVGALDLDDNDESPTLRWQAQPGARFHAQMARDETFTDTVADVELDAPVWKLTGQPRGQYFVRLQVRDASGLTGPFSPPRRVRIGAVVRTGSGSSLLSGDGAPVERP